MYPHLPSLHSRGTLLHHYPREGKEHGRHTPLPQRGRAHTFSDINRFKQVNWQHHGLLRHQHQYQALSSSTLGINPWVGRNSVTAACCTGRCLCVGVFYLFSPPFSATEQAAFKTNLGHAGCCTHILYMAYFQHGLALHGCGPAVTLLALHCWAHAIRNSLHPRGRLSWMEERLFHIPSILSLTCHCTSPLHTMPLRHTTCHHAPPTCSHCLPFPGTSSSWLRLSAEKGRAPPPPPYCRAGYSRWTSGLPLGTTPYPRPLCHGLGWFINIFFWTRLLLLTPFNTCAFIVFQNSLIL